MRGRMVPAAGECRARESATRAGVEGSATDPCAGGWSGCRRRTERRGFQRRYTCFVHGGNARTTRVLAALAASCSGGPRTARRRLPDRNGRGGADPPAALPLDLGLDVLRWDVRRWRRPRSRRGPPASLRGRARNAYPRSTMPLRSLEPRPSSTLDPARWPPADPRLLPAGR